MGVLKTLAVGLGVLTAGGAVAMAVPEVRNKTLDWIAPHSQIYKTQAEDLANTQTELEQTKQTLADKQTQVDTLTLDKQNLTNQVNDLHSQIIQKDNQLNELNSTLQAKEQELETQTEYLETCQTKALEIKTKIETLTQEDSQLNAQAIATLQDDLLKIETEVTNVENRISTLNGSISNLNANISTLTQEKQDLQATVDSLNAQVESLNNQINGLNEQITSLQEQVQALSNSDVIMTKNGFKLATYSTNSPIADERSFLDKRNTIDFVGQSRSFLTYYYDESIIAFGFAESYNVTIKSLNSTQTFTGDTYNQLHFSEKTNKSINWFYSNGTEIKNPDTVFKMFANGEVRFEVLYSADNNRNLENLIINCYTTIDEFAINNCSLSGVYTYKNPMGRYCTLDFRTMMSDGVGMSMAIEPFTIDEVNKKIYLNDISYTYKIQDNNLVLDDMLFERTLSNISKIGQNITSPTYVSNNGNTLKLDNQLTYNGQSYDLIIASATQATYFNYSTKDCFTLEFKENKDYKYTFIINDEIYTASEPTVPHLESKYVGQYGYENGFYILGDTYMIDSTGGYCKLISFDGSNAKFGLGGDSSTTITITEDETGIYLKGAKKVDVDYRINDKFQGWYHCDEDVSGIYVGPNCFCDCKSSTDYSLFSHESNNYIFNDNGNKVSVEFVKNANETISFEYNGKTYTKQA